MAFRFGSRFGVRRFLSAKERSALSCRWPPQVQKRALIITRMLRPYEVPGARKIRVGGPQDGAYVMLDDFEGVEEVFSLGIGPNVDWDFAVAEKGLIVHQFDHTVDGPPRRHANFRFNRRMISATPTPDSETLETMLDRVASRHPRSIILKMDIENAEWAVLANCPDAVFDRFSQIICEFHAIEYLHLEWHWQDALRGLTNLKRNFEVIHVHANNAASINFVDGRPIPFVIEVTLVNRARYDTRASAEEFPGPLDRPNDPGKPDYRLGRFDQ